MHPTKTKVAYSKDEKRKGEYPNVKFDFLGYCFRPRLVRRFRDNSLVGGFNPAVSSSAMKAMRATIRDLNLRRQTQLSLQDIARQLNPLLRGWIAYYGRYAPRRCIPCCDTSIRHSWRGRCVSSSASNTTKSKRVSSFNGLRRIAWISLYIGRSG